MTVPSTKFREDYAGNGSATSFPYAFRIFKNTDLVVTKTDNSGNETTLTLGTDYTVTGAGSYNGGAVVLTTALPTSYRLTIERVLAIRQDTDLRNQGEFLPETHEDAFDRLTMIVQRLAGYLGMGQGGTLRTLLLGTGDVDGAGAFRARGNRISGLGNPIDDADAAGKRWTQEQIASAVNVDGSSMLGVFAITIDTIAGASSLLWPDKAMVFAKGRDTIGDGGGGPLRYSASSTQTADGGTVFAPAGGGRLFRDGWTVFGFNGALNAKWFGAKADGITDDAPAFHAAISALAAFGTAGEIYAPTGVYGIKDMKIMRPNVKIRGEVSEYSYNQSVENATVFRVLSGANWGVLIGAEGDYATNWGNGAGLSRVTLDGEWNVEFGLAICVGWTVVTDVTVKRFEYGFVGASFLNSNIFERCNFYKNTKIGFAMVDRFGVGTALENANPAMYGAGVTFPYYNGYSTVITANLCNIRENGYGLVIIQADGAIFNGGVIESNTRCGLWAYRELKGGGTNNKINRDVTFNNVWMENNWNGYIQGNSYSNTGWRYVSYTPGTIYDPVVDAGYNIFAAGYDANSFPESYTFNGGKLTAYGKLIRGKRSKFFKFNQSALVSQTQPVQNVDLTTDAINYTFERCTYDPYAPNATAQKAYILTQGTGTWIIESEKVNTAAGVLRDYQEGTWSATLKGRTATGNYPLRVNDGRYTRVGRTVNVSFYTDANTINAVGSGDLILDGLPFAYPALQNLGGTGVSSGGVIGACLSNLPFTGSQLVVKRAVDTAGTSLMLVGVSNTGVSTPVPITAVSTGTTLIQFSFTYTI